jgi:hypothetical protein
MCPLQGPFYLRMCYNGIGSSFTYLLFGALLANTSGGVAPVARFHQQENGWLGSKVTEWDEQPEGLRAHERGQRM